MSVDREASAENFSTEDTNIVIGFRTQVLDKYYATRGYIVNKG